MALASRFEQLDIGVRHLRRILITRARIEGFLLFDYADRYEEGRRQLAAWAREGRLRHRHDVLDGIEQMPLAFLRLVRSENFGKQLVRITSPGCGPVLSDPGARAIDQPASSAWSRRRDRALLLLYRYRSAASGDPDGRKPAAEGRQGLGIKLRLLALVLVAALPVLLVEVWSQDATRRQRMDDESQAVLAAARLVASEQDQYFESARNIIATYLQSSTVLKGCSAYLTRLVQIFFAYTGFGFAMPDGTIACSSDPRFIGQSLADRSYLQETLAKKGFAIGSVVRGPASGQRIVGMAYPLTDDKGGVQIVGVLGLRSGAALERDGPALFPAGFGGDRHRCARHDHGSCSGRRAVDRDAGARRHRAAAAAGERA